MARPYPPEIRDFIRASVAGRSTRELAALTNERFGTRFTESSMKSYKSNHGLRSGLPKGTPRGMPSKQFPAEVRAYIEANHRGVGPCEMAEALNRVFGTSYTKSQIKGYYGNNGISSGLTGRFEKGHVPFNKGRKGWSAPGTEATRFRPGRLPHNTKPVGWERKDDEGFTYVKVRMRPSRSDCNDNFAAKHRLIWEEAHGPVPPGHVVIFKDGDRENFALSNLALVSWQENQILNRRGLRSSDPALTEAGIAAAKVRAELFRRKRKEKESGRSKKRA